MWDLLIYVENVVGRSLREECRLCIQKLHIDSNGVIVVLIGIPSV